MDRFSRAAAASPATSPAYGTTMKISGNDIRPGNVIQHKGGLWVAVKTQHTQPGKGGAYMQVELKNLRDGTKLNERFRSSETVERVRLDQKTYQFLFENGLMLTLMDSETYEQVEVPRDLVGDRAAFLQDGMEITVESHEGTPLRVELPDQVTLAVEETEPTMRGQTAAASYKPALLENGVRVMVPPFVSNGDRIIVDTNAVSYVRRAE
jgi:elongation factor P